MDRIATKTLAEIYLKQGHFREAYEIFKILAEKDPSDLGIKNNLEALTKQFASSSTDIPRPLRSKEEHIHFLENWLDNIRKRRRE